MIFTLEETKKFWIWKADRIAESPEVSHVADGKRLPLFFTKINVHNIFSFESAMLSLGGKSPWLCRYSKGETVADTARVVAYADIIAISQGRRFRASMYATVPVINAGDGGHNHPQIDLMTIRQRKGHLDHLTVGFYGDLKFGRTVHSRVNSLERK